MSRRTAFAWLGAGGRARNRFVLFRHDFALQDVPPAAALHLFADSRYRLRVNGTFVYAGPPRFVTQFPEYDTVDLRPHLKPGANCLTVEVNAFGASSYQTMPDGRGGFMAWGAIAAGGDAAPIDLATPGAWQARELSAWDASAPLYSFAQNPVEICDTRKLEDAWFLPGPAATTGWLPAEPVPLQDAPWGELRPSTAPVIPYSPVTPVAILFSASLDVSESHWGFSIPNDYLGSAQAAPKGLYVGFSTWIHAPCEQTVPVGLHWGDYGFNGSPVRTQPHPLLGNRSDATLTFRKGWNHLTGVVEFTAAAEFWSVLVGLPKDSGLRPRARPDHAQHAVFSVSPLMPRAALSLAWSDDRQAPLPDGWRLDAGDPYAVCPARLSAWTRPAVDAARGLPYADLDHVADVGGAGRAWVLEFKGGALGHITLDIEAPAGTVVDVGFDDWLRADGMIDLYRTNPFVNSVERAILRGGRQQFQLFHSRGGLYVQVVVRLPPGQGAGAKARLYGVGVLATQTIPGMAGSFRSSNPTLDAIWQAASATLVASTEDSYSDSPWRERGTYIGDAYVNVLLHPLLHHDLVVARRVIRLFAQAATPDGQMPCVVPACLALPHEDFTLIWVLMLHAFWSVTGDHALVEELWPTVRGVLAGRGHAVHASGLWNSDGRRLFIDWGVIPGEREGQANAVLNAFRIAALEHAAELASAMGHGAEESRLRQAAETLRAAFSRTLWLEGAGRFAAGLTADGPMQTTAVHANILAYRFNIGTPRQQACVERYVIEQTGRNYRRGLEQGPDAGYVELYFLAYLLPALGEHGHAALAEALMVEHLSPILAAGDRTLPESFRGRARSEGSRCHSWSGYPAVYLTRYLLGLRQATPGEPDHFIVDPRASEAITEAEGCLPHPKGLVRVAWQRTTNGLTYAVNAPEGVNVEMAQEKASPGHVQAGH